MRSQFDRQVIRYVIAAMINTIRLEKTKGNSVQELENKLNGVFSQRHRLGYTTSYVPFLYW